MSNCNTEELIKLIEKYIPSWGIFKIEKKDKFWFVHISIDSQYIKEFSFETCSTTLRDSLNTAYTMLYAWIMREEDSDRIKELREEYERPTN